jgi:acyl-CoA synthetase (AMP-forming)/AMP-acid ligase II
VGLWDWFLEPPGDRGLHLAGADQSDWQFHSYAHLAGLTRRAAWRLREIGVAAGDVVSVARSGGPEFVADFFGALMIGATPAPVAPPLIFGDERRYREHVGRIIRSSGSVVLTGTPDVLNTLRPVAEQLGIGVVGEVTDETPQWNGAVTPPRIAVIQHSSGSTATPKGVRIPFESLQANVTAMRHWLGLTGADSFATWLPMYHDMGLIGTLILPLDSTIDVWQMRPDQFIRSPERWLRCFEPGRATVTATPTLGLGHVVRRVRASDVDDLDLSGWRNAVVGAERIDIGVVRSFVDRFASCGLRPDVMVPAYGLAESTLAVTGRRAGYPLRTVTVDPASLVMGGAVTTGVDDRTGVTVVSCGHPMDGVTVAVVDPAGEPVGEERLGEIEVGGRSLADGYTGTPPTAIEGVLRTGDAGFWHRGELYVIGRLGDSVKQFGRWYFAEDAEQRAVAASPHPARTTAMVGGLHGRNTAVVLVEATSGEDAGGAIGAAVARQAVDLRILVLGVPGGTIRRTTSGKPMRRSMWHQLETGGIASTVWWDSDWESGTAPAAAAGRVAPMAP